MENKVEQIKAKLIQIKERNLLPKGYGKTIAEEFDITRNDVYQYLNGRRFNIEIAERLFELAYNNREKQLLEKMNKFLEE